MQFSVDLYTFIIMPVLILCSNEEIQERTSKVYIIYCLWLLSVGLVSRRTDHP